VKCKTTTFNTLRGNHLVYVFTGCAPPLHSGVYVSGHFNDLAAVAFLPPPRSPAKSMRKPRSPPLLSHWNNEATPSILLHGKPHPLNTYHYSIIPMVSEANDVLFRRDFFIDMIMDIMVLKPLSESRGWGGIVKW